MTGGTTSFGDPDFCLGIGLSSGRVLPVLDSNFMFCPYTISMLWYVAVAASWCSPRLCVGCCFSCIIPAPSSLLLPQTYKHNSIPTTQLTRFDSHSSTAQLTQLYTTQLTQLGSGNSTHATQLALLTQLNSHNSFCTRSHNSTHTTYSQNSCLPQLLEPLYTHKTRACRRGCRVVGFKVKSNQLIQLAYEVRGDL